jgi:hypothetical protein
MIIKLGDYAFELNRCATPDEDLFDKGWTCWLAKRWGGFYFIRWKRTIAKK